MFLSWQTHQWLLRPHYYFRGMRAESFALVALISQGILVTRINPLLTHTISNYPTSIHPESTNSGSPQLSTSRVLIHQDHDALCVVAADHRCDVHPISKVPILPTLSFPPYDYSTTTNSSCRVSLPSNSERLNSSPYQEVMFSEPPPSRRRCHPA